MDTMFSGTFSLACRTVFVVVLGTCQKNKVGTRICQQQEEKDQGAKTHCEWRGNDVGHYRHGGLHFFFLVHCNKEGRRRNNTLYVTQSLDSIKITCFPFPFLPKKVHCHVVFCLDLFLDLSNKSPQTTSKSSKRVNHK